MDPETPSRRTPPGEEPVTIDLEAVREDKPEETAAAAPGETAEAEPAPAGDEPTNAKPESARPESAEATPVRETVPPRAEPPRKGGGASSFAAGIVGGLVALLGAGSLQYGGYLPALSPGQGDDGRLAALTGEVEALRTQVSGISIPPAADLAPLETRLAALEEVKPAEAAGPDPEVERLSAELAALREAVARAGEAAGAAESRLAERLAVAEEKLDAPRSDIEMARAVAASALKTAIDRGGPYLAELEALASVAPDDPSIAGLREHAALGVSSRADLARDFSEAADRILDAVHQPAGDQGIINRLMASAASAIRVRPVGSIEGDTPEAIVARIENKLQNGDFKGAQIEWQALPEAAQAAGADYKRALDQRVAVEALVGGAVSGALSGGSQG